MAYHYTPPMIPDFPLYSSVETFKGRKKEKKRMIKKRDID
jgi:hypothetical protein